MTAPLDVIAIENLTVDCVVGLYAHEKIRPQALEVSLSLFLDARPAHEKGIEGTVDYGRLAGEIQFLLKACRFELLEHAAEALAQYVLAPPTADAPRAQVHQVTLTVRKPNALLGKGVPSLTITRHAKDFQPKVETKPFGKVDVLYENNSVGVYRLRVKPKGCIPTHIHKVMTEHEMVLGQGLWLQNQPVRRGTVTHWPKEFPHRYDNPSDIEQTVLCVDSPAFIPEDEIEVAFPQERLVMPETEFLYPEGDGGKP